MSGTNTRDGYCTRVSAIEGKGLRLRIRPVAGKLRLHFFKDIRRKGLHRSRVQKVVNGLQTEGVVAGAARLIDPFDVAGVQVDARPFTPPLAMSGQIQVVFIPLILVIGFPSSRELISNDPMSLAVLTVRNGAKTLIRPVPFTTIVWHNIRQCLPLQESERWLKRTTH